MSPLAFWSGAAFHGDGAFGDERVGTRAFAYDAGSTKGLLWQAEAAERLDLSVRQVKRLLRRWRASGDAGLISRQFRRPSLRRLDAAKRSRIGDLLRATYPDFGATLAAEKLGERERIEVSWATVRRKSWPRKTGQGVKWIFCMTAA